MKKPPRPQDSLRAELFRRPAGSSGRGGRGNEGPARAVRLRPYAGGPSRGRGSRRGDCEGHAAQPVARERAAERRGRAAGRQGSRHRFRPLRTPSSDWRSVALPAAEGRRRRAGPRGGSGRVSGRRAASAAAGRAVAMATRPAAAARAFKGRLVPGGGPSAPAAGSPGPGREGRPAAEEVPFRGPLPPRLVSWRPRFPQLLLENEEKPQQEDVFSLQATVCVSVCLCLCFCV